MITVREPRTGEINGCAFRVCYPETRHFAADMGKSAHSRALECLNRSAIVNQEATK